MPKRGVPIIRGGAIFGGNTVSKFHHILSQFRLGQGIDHIHPCKSVHPN